MIDVGFLVIAAAGRAELRPFARDARLAQEHLDYWEDDLRAFLVMGRLHYRDEHLRWLRGRTSPAEHELHRGSNAALCAALYREGGFAALRSIEGEFAVVGIDRSTRRLVVLRDPVGTHPCFWARTRDRVLVATTLRAFADHMDALEVDGEFLADFFALSRDSFSELPTERTVYRQINRLPPGWCLDIDLASGEARRSPYWRWRASWTAAVGSADEAAAAVRRALEAAVAERLSRKGRTACHFSGGFDSTALALVANRLLLARGQELDALTLAYSRDPAQAGEASYVAAALSGQDGIRHHRCAADDLVEFADHDRMPLIDEPSPMVSDFRRIELLLETARQAGADSVLTGDGGDILFQRSPALMVAELLRRGRVREAVGLARAKALARSDATGDILRDACRLALPRIPRRRRAEALPEGLRWLAPDFAARHDVAARVQAWEARHREDAFTLDRVPALAGDWYHWNLAVPLGMVQTQPFFDPRLMALVAALPRDLAVVAEPMKPLLAAAVADLLPEKILKRPRKGHFNVVLSGFALHKDWLLGLVRDAPSDGFIDRAALSDDIELAAMGAFADAPAANRLCVAISFLAWSGTRADWRSRQVPYLDGPLPRSPSRRDGDALRVTTASTRGA